MKFPSANIIFIFAILRHFSLALVITQVNNLTDVDLQDRQDAFGCLWGNTIIDGRHGSGCYCAFGCLDPLNVCDLMFGKCHSDAIRNSVKALGALAVAAAVATSLL